MNKLSLIKSNFLLIALIAIFTFQLEFLSATTLILFATPPICVTADLALISLNVTPLKEKHSQLTVLVQSDGLLKETSIEA